MPQMPFSVTKLHTVLFFAGAPVLSSALLFFPLCIKMLCWSKSALLLKMYLQPDLHRGSGAVLLPNNGQWSSVNIVMTIDQIVFDFPTLRRER